MTRIQYKTAQKDEAQKKIEQPILESLRCRALRKSRIIFSAYMDFSISSSGELLIYIREKDVISKGKPTRFNPVYMNMQGDAAAFEGWAICLKSQLPEQAVTVRLKWDEPVEITGTQTLHYYRFLYRVIRFREMYPWFCVDSRNESKLQNFTSSINGLYVNSSNSEPRRKAALCENQIESDIVEHNNELMSESFNLQRIYRQLPVGVKGSQGRDFFTGKASAIDLWGVGPHMLTIFELKYIKSSGGAKNIKVGIISELFFYASVMRDIALGIIGTPKNKCKLPKEQDLYGLIKKGDAIRSIHAVLFANMFHPMVDHRLLETLNNNTSKEDRINIQFSMSEYDWDEHLKKIEIKCK